MCLAQPTRGASRGRSKPVHRVGRGTPLRGPARQDAGVSDDSGTFAQVGRRDAEQRRDRRPTARGGTARPTDYYAEHGAFLGDERLRLGTRGPAEADAHLLGDARRHAGSSRSVPGAGQCSPVGGHPRRAGRGHRPVRGMLRERASAQPQVQPTRPGCRPRSPSATRPALPFADASFDVVFTAYGVVPFVADSAALMREAARVLRPGGRFVFSTTHPIRWALPDDPGPAGLTARGRTSTARPTSRRTRRGRRRTSSTTGPSATACASSTAAGLVLVDLVEPEWPASNTQVWGGWSPLRGALVPGTAIFVTVKI